MCCLIIHVDELGKNYDTFFLVDIQTLYLQTRYFLNPLKAGVCLNNI
jgi:hypothetical protein